MTFEVLSSRMGWPVGTVIGEGVLAGCNIAALVEGGHLMPVPKTTRKRTPVVPVPDTADEPEEQD
jgi:uncharacterized integral membrane protein